MLLLGPPDAVVIGVAEETIRARMSVYQAQTAPLVDHYGKRGILAEVDGLGSIEGVLS
jgi:adenylate kinase